MSKKTGHGQLFDRHFNKNDVVSSRQATEKSTSVKTTEKKQKLNSLEKLYVFLNKYRAETKKKSGQNLPWTHSSMHGMTGKFDIPDDATREFHSLYIDAVLDGFQPHITEKHKEYGPIIVDFDFVQSKDDKDRFYTKRNIEKAVAIYHKLIEKYIDCDLKDIQAYVTEKNEPVLRDSKYHDGFHIMYPFICTKPSTQFIIREDFIEEAKKQNIFKNIPIQNDWEDVFDKKPIYHTGWLMYGSRKNNNYDSYKLSYIFASSNGEPYNTLFPGDESLPYSVKHLVKETSIRKFDERDINSTSIHVDDQKFDERVKKIASKINIERRNDLAAADFLGKDMSFIKVTNDEELFEAKNLVKMLSTEMAKYYKTWYPIGRCLHNIDHRLLNDWIEFSKKYPKKFKEGECEMLWKKMKPSNYTIRTLHYYAMKDNPQKYFDYKMEKVGKLMDEAIEGSHYTIAKMLMEEYGFMYRCASIKHNIWYEFVGHKWVKVECAYTLNNLISTKIAQRFKQMKSALLDDVKGQEGRRGKALMEDVLVVNKVIAKLHDSNFKKNVIAECAIQAFDPKFMELLDENPRLLCFNNGIYDLETSTFRDGCPDDYVSLCTNYDYINYDKNDEFSIAIDEFIGKIEPEFDMREYIITLLSTCLSGSIKEESFYVFTGSGANGKSKLMELLKNAMGDYYKPMDIRLLTEKRSSSSAASPEIADKKGIRACPFDEPKSTDEINTGFMKIFTGGDIITARALFQEPIYFKPQFKPFLLCNHLPNINADDDGTWRRLKVIPFRSKFVKQGEMTKEMKEGKWPERTFPADMDISDKIVEWNQMFMAKLIAYYGKYKHDGGLIHPDLVLEHTNNYRKRCDVIQDFMTDYLVRTGKNEDVIAVNKVFENLKIWHKANYNGRSPTNKELRGYLKTRLGCLDEDRDQIKGFRIKPTLAANDDLDNDEDSEQ